MVEHPVVKSQTFFEELRTRLKKFVYSFMSVRSVELRKAGWAGDGPIVGEGKLHVSEQSTRPCFTGRVTGDK